MGLLGGVLLLVAPSALLVTIFAQDGDGIHPLAATTTSAPLNINSTEFGMAFISSVESPAGENRVQRGVESGARLDRFPLYWGAIEPSEGNFQWSAQDSALRTNERQGLGTLAILMGTPGQYYPSGEDPRPADVPFPIDEGPLPGEGEGPRAAASCTSGQPPPRDLNQPIWSDGSDNPGPGKTVNADNPWARFVHETVNRYRPGGAAGTNVRYWEIWNEPDLCFFWSGSPQQYVRLLKVAYLVIKQVDPSATVMWGGLAHFEQSGFLQAMVNELSRDPMAASHNGFFDAAASHHYFSVRLGYTYTSRIRTSLRGAGWEEKPIWITESGVPVCGSYPGPDCPSPYRATAEEQAAYIWQNIAYTRVAGGGPIFHFQLYDDCGNETRREPPADAFGLVSNESGSYCTPHSAESRLSYRAYQTAARTLANTEVLWQEFQSNGAYLVAFYDPATRERKVMLWQREGDDVTAEVAATGSDARLVSLDGSEERRSPSNGRYGVGLPRATNQNMPNNDTPDPWDYIPLYAIGGRPYLLVERDTLPPVPTMAPLPAVSPTTFEIAWDVDDKGSGIANVEIWLQMDDGQWQRYLENQPAKGGTWVQGELEHRYRFAVQATDRAGNSLDAAVVLAETLVSNTVPSVRVWGEVRDVNGQPARNVPLSIGLVNGSTDDQGNFSLDVPIGAWDVTVNGQVIHRGYTFNQETHLSLTLAPPDMVRVWGQVRDMTSRPLPYLPFSIGSVRGVTDPTGHYNLWVKKGQYDVAVDSRVFYQGYGFSEETHLSLVVPPASTANVPVRNGGFDAGTDGWSVGGNAMVGTVDRPNYGRVLHLGTRFEAQPGVEGEDGSSGANSTISQEVTLPQGNPNLTFAYRVQTEETTQRATGDKLEVIIYYNDNGQVKARYLYTEQRSLPWLYYFYNLSEWAGQRVTIVFNLYQSSPNRPTTAWIDEVTIGESAPVTQWRPIYLPMIHGR